MLPGVPDSQCVVMECDPDPRQGHTPWCPAPEGQRPSYVETIVLQVVQQRLWEWQLVRRVCVSVDGDASQVLQSRKSLWLVQGLRQLERHSAVLSHVFGRVRLCLGMAVIRRLALWHVA